MSSSSGEASGYSIGEFSAITGLSVKALRHYHELGVLEPASIDEATGYRYYADAQVAAAATIAELRALDMPLSEIRQVLAGHGTALLEQHLMRLRARVESDIRRLAHVRHLLAKENHVSYDIETKTVPAIVGLRVHLEGSATEAAIAMNAGFGQLALVLRSRRADLAGPPMMVLHRRDESGVSVDLVYPTSVPVQGLESVESAELPGTEVLSTIHAGPHESIGDAIAALGRAARDAGRTPSGPLRTIHLAAPLEVVDPNDFLTEVQLPIG